MQIWMCGGVLEIVVCSHVGHIFRKRSPYKWRTGVNVVKKNSIRLAQVWMDEYAKYYFDRFNNDLVSRALNSTYCRHWFYLLFSLHPIISCALSGFIDFLKFFISTNSCQRFGCVFSVWWRLLCIVILLKLKVIIKLVIGCFEEFIEIFYLNQNFSCQ